MGLALLEVRDKRLVLALVEVQLQGGLHLLVREGRQLLLLLVAHRYGWVLVNLIGLIGEDLWLLHMGGVEDALGNGADLAGGKGHLDVGDLPYDGLVLVGLNAREGPYDSKHVVLLLVLLYWLLAGVVVLLVTE